MVFNSYTFLVLFLVVCAIDHLPISWRSRKINLLVASYVFYAAWNPPFVLLLVIAAVVDYYLAAWLYRTEQEGRRRFILISSLTLSLGLLGYFKYGAFLLETFVDVIHHLGFAYSPAKPSIVLPLGISFYTFETISYLVDVYRKKLKPSTSFLDYALFLTFFPHLVSGPIVRASDFLPQCREERRASVEQFGWGLALVVLGLSEKLVLADTILAPVVDSVYGATKVGFTDAWVGAVAFSGQIFFDFAGYSTCAIGIAHCLGFVLKPNFRFPYAATGFSDFWTRWHISLSSWLRDYLYISLGGNRRGAARTSVNLMLTMLLGGLWHGASWRFLAWGGLHGLYLIGERVLRSVWKAEPRQASSSNLGQLPGALLTFVLVTIAWVFFRAPDFATSFQMLWSMFSVGAISSVVSIPDRVNVAVVVTGLLTAHWYMRDHTFEQLIVRLPWWVRAAGLAALVVALTLATGQDRSFIYFNF